MVKKISAVLMVVFMLFSKPTASYAQNKEGKVKKVADFTLFDLNNDKVSLYDYSGSVVLLFFWTTWCPYCRSGIKQIKSNFEELSRKGLKVLAVNVGEPSSRIKGFMDKEELPFTVVMDRDTTVAKSFGLFGVPTYVIIDKDGLLRLSVNYFPEDELKALLSN